VLKHAQERLLNRILGILPVVRDRLSDSEEFLIISKYELVKSGYISVLNGMDKVQVLINNFSHNELG
jgi:hypothetical protein